MSFPYQIDGVALQANDAMLAAMYPDNSLFEYSAPLPGNATPGGNNFGVPSFDTSSFGGVSPEPITPQGSPDTSSGGGGSRYASDADVHGECDRCGATKYLNELKYEIYNRVRNGWRVCSECLDKDNSQLWVGEAIVDDASQPRDPRPDKRKAASRGMASANPVRVPMPLTISLGKVG